MRAFVESEVGENNVCGSGVEVWRIGRLGGERSLGDARTGDFSRDLFGAGTDLP